MYQQKLLFWCSFFYYLVNIYSIFVAVLLYLQGRDFNIAYFITFFCFFGIDKVTIIFILVQYGEGSTLLSICDIFQIGFIYIFFEDKFDSYDIKIFLKNKLFSRIIPQIIMEFYFFCFHNNDNPQSVQIETLFTFVLFLVLFCCIMHVIKVYDEYQYSRFSQKIYNFKDKAFIFCKFFLTQLPYYLSICAFTFYEDKLGINLSWYNVVLALLTIIGYLIYKSPSSNDFSQFIYNYILFNGVRLNHFDFDNQTSGTSKYLSIATYINQMIRVILLSLFSSDDIIENSDSNKAQQILIYMTLALSFLQFIFLFQDNYYMLFKILEINIHSEHDIPEANKKLRNKKFQKIEVIIYKKSNNNNQGLFQHLIVSSLEKEILNFVELITKCEKSKSFFRIYLLELPHYFADFKFQILTKLENIHYNLYSFLTENLQKNSCLEILKQRIKNGFLFSKINTNLSENSFNYQLQQNHQRCFYLQITLFDKLISPNMQFQPSQVLYDLYQEY